MSKNIEFDRLLDKMQAIHASKEQDYTGDCSPHFNFRFTEEFLRHFHSDTDKPYAALIGTKIARLIVLLNQSIPNPKNEPIEDTFVDLANYILLWASRHASAKVR